jgi:hypothetical protein
VKQREVDTEIKADKYSDMITNETGVWFTAGCSEMALVWRLSYVHPLLNCGMVTKLCAPLTKLCYGD